MEFIGESLAGLPWFLASPPVGFHLLPLVINSSCCRRH